MRCREAKRLLNERNVGDPELAEHIRACPACARRAAAAGLIETALHTIRRDADEAPTPLADLRARLESHPARTSRKERLRMAELTHRLSSRKRLGFAVGIAVAALLFFVLVPFSYDRVVGYDLTISGLPAGQQIEAGTIVKALDALGINGASVSADYAASETAVHITNLTDPGAVQRASAAFTAVTGLKGETKMEPRIQTVSGSLYAQVQEKLTRIEVSTVGGTPEEVQAEIEGQLEAMGFAGAKADVTVDDTGVTTIQITVPGEE